MGKKRGFALLTPSQRKAVSRQGGKAVSKSNVHMALIGSTGGKVTASKPGFLAAIGKIGGSR